jgi:hypothetical protein
MVAVPLYEGMGCAPGARIEQAARLLSAIRTNAIGMPPKAVPLGALLFSCNSPKRIATDGQLLGFPPLANLLHRSHYRLAVTRPNFDRSPFFRRLQR